MIQGLSLGGEYGSSATYLCEMAGRERRGFWSSFQYVTMIGGQLIALALLLVLQAALGEAALEAWGWRIAFAAGAVLAVVVFFIRRRLDETRELRAMSRRMGERRARSSGRNLFRDHPREALLVMALTAGGTLAFYAYTTYMQKFLANTVGFDRADGIADHDRRAGGLHAASSRSPAAARDRIGRKPLMIFFGAAGMLFTYPIFTALETDAAIRRPPSRWSWPPGHRHRLHLDQRGGEGRAVSRPHPRARRGVALCDRQRDVRRHGRICRAVRSRTPATSAGSTSMSRW